MEFLACHGKGTYRKQRLLEKRNKGPKGKKNKINRGKEQNYNAVQIPIINGSITPSQHNNKKEIINGSKEH